MKRSMTEIVCGIICLICIIGLIYCSVVLIFVYTKKPKIIYNTIISIVSLKREKNIEGSFFLGCGSIRSVDYHYTYSITPNNTYKLIKFPVRDCEIIEDGNKYIIKQDNKSNLSQSIIFHVPSGTIVKRFQG